MKDLIHWLGHASIRLTGEKTIYIDPWNIKNPLPADIILVTHEHYDHFSQDDIKKIQQPQTDILIPKTAEKKIPGNVTYVEPNKSYTVQNIIIETVPAYNTEKSFHPKQANHILRIKRSMFMHRWSDYSGLAIPFKRISIKHILAHTRIPSSW